MDLTALDLGQTSHTTRDRNPGRDILESDDGLFADALLEMAELRDTDTYDELDDRTDDSDTSSEDAETDTDTATTDTETKRGGGDHAADDPLDPSTITAASTKQSGEINAASLLTQITSGVSTSAGQTTSPSDAVTSVTAGRAAETIVAAGQMTAHVSTAAALQGEARVLAKRSDTIAANDEHAQGVKAELSGKAGEASMNKGANGQAAKADNALVPATAGREAMPPNSEIARLDQALRQAFSATTGETAGAASANTATNPMARPGGETLLAQRGADQSVESGSHLAGTGERPTPVATAKAAAARPAFNLPAGRPAEQVSVQIQNGLRNGSDRIQIKLTPASLGTVEVKLELGPDKTVQAIVSADKPETLDMLERDARVLQKALEEAGLRTNSDSLSFSQRETGTSANAEREGDGSTDSGAAETQIETQARRSHDGLIDIEA